MISEKVRVEYLLMIIFGYLISAIVLNLLNLDSNIGVFCSWFTVIIISLKVYRFIYKKSLFNKVKKGILDYLTYLENIWVAIFLSFILIIAVNKLSTTIWSYVFAILLSYLIAEFLSSSLIKGGKGIVQFPAIGNSTQHHGHAYFVFVISIILGTLASSWFSTKITIFVSSLTGWQSLMIPNLILIAVIAGNFYTLFLRR